MNESYWENYEKWYGAAKEEFENGEFYEGSYGSDFEIMDNGSVHLQGNLYHTIKNAVTSWYNSEFYTE